MPSISMMKEQSATDTPVLFFECRFPDGAMERWATHAVRLDGVAFEERVLSHNAFELSGGTEDGLDWAARLTLTLQNTDSRLSQLEQNVGFRGATITVKFAFCDLSQGGNTTPAMFLFRGATASLEQTSQTRATLSFGNRLDLQRILLPTERIQKRCGWSFPATADEREEAMSGLDRGKYSPFFRCGYSPDQQGGVGTMGPGGQPFTTCGHTAAACQERGMYRTDAAGRATRRFGGIQFVPSSVLVRGAGDRSFKLSPVVENQAKYNDFVPMVYGTAWFAPPLVFSRNDGNLTRMQVLLGLGEMDAVLKVLVNGVEMPQGVAGQNMTSTGWYNVVSLGNRTGNFDGNFANSAGEPAGDPFGSLAYLSVVAPNRLANGSAAPKIEVLVRGLKLSVFDAEGNYSGEEHSANPAWVILDALRRVGWGLSELDLKSFSEAAAVCASPVQARDWSGATVSVPRYQANVALLRKQSAAEVLRGVRQAANLMFGYSADGKLQVMVEDRLSRQQPVRRETTNAALTLSGGWPAYEFGDGTAGRSGIVRRPNGESSLRVLRRPSEDTLNRVSVEFQDEWNDYQQDSLSITATDEVAAQGFEMAGTVAALGIANPDQARRLCRLALLKAVEGNLHVEFETSMKGLGVRPGDLITLTYAKEGFDRQLFRVLRVSPRLNFQTALIRAQIHNDAWYEDDGTSDGFGGRRGRRADDGTPRSLMGAAENGSQFAVQEESATGADGSGQLSLRTFYVPPSRTFAPGLAIPVLALQPQMEQTGGQLRGAQRLLYAVAAAETGGGESGLSFAAQAVLPAGTNTNAITLSGIRARSGTAAVNIYRGSSLSTLRRIGSVAPGVSTFRDDGLPGLPVMPPDPNFDHANFYWRLELQPPCAVIARTARSVSHASLLMETDQYRGQIVRMMSGSGRGQERRVVANDATTLVVDADWTVMPGLGDEFAVVEPMRFGGSTQTETVSFPIPNRRGAVVQILGLAANARDQESSTEEAVVTRWQVGGAAGDGLDVEAPPRPFFGLDARGNGRVELGGVGFADLANTRSVTAGTLNLFYWNELTDAAVLRLTGAIPATATTIQLNGPATVPVGSFLQIGREILAVQSVAGTQVQVARAALGSIAEAQAGDTRVYPLAQMTCIAPFAKGLFGSPASGTYTARFDLANCRIAAATLYVTNTKGDSPVAVVAYTSNTDFGLRTLRGGALVMQSQGYLAVQSAAIPAVPVPHRVSVRDVFATVAEAPMGGPIALRLSLDGEPYCDLTIPAGSLLSETLSGTDLPLLPEKAVVGVDVVEVPGSGAGRPGRDLTVTLRL